jgi:hypothetical protein
VGILQAMVVLTLSLTCTDAAKKAAEATKERVLREERVAASTDAPAEAPTHFKVQWDFGEEEAAIEVLVPREAAQPPAPSSLLLPLAPAPLQLPPAPASIEEPPSVKANLARDFRFWAGMLATLQLIQWIVVALSRDYHDAISRDVSLLTAIKPEDEPITPRVRIDLPWVARKLSRRIRAMLVFLAGMPALFMLTAPLPFTDELLAVLVPAWSAYWFVVFTAAKSARAWDDEAAGAPWFVRAWTWLTTRVPGLRWRVLQRYGLFLENRTRSVFAPAAEVERQPWAFAGLAVIEALAMLPVLKCFLRPLVPVAAAHLLAAQRAAAAAVPPSELPAPPPAASATAA